VEGRNKRIKEVQPAFFFRGRFMGYENAIETIGEPDYAVELITDADVGVLLSKDCSSGLTRVTASCWLASYLPPSLRGHLQGQGELSLGASVAVAGDVLVRDHLAALSRLPTLTSSATKAN
jgi:fatty acid synthase subunit alpha